jgi:hypothetical protein
MNPRRRLLLILLLSVSLLCLFWLALGPPEPVYQGKPFSVWVLDLDDQHPGPKNDQAEEAVRQMGVKALPQIIGMLNTRSSSPLDKIMKWATAHHLTKRTYTEPEIKHRRAIFCCFMLGPQAKAALPALIDLLNSTDFSNQASDGYIAVALVYIGPDSVKPLIRTLTSTNPYARFEATFALGSFRSNAPVIVPELIRCMKDKSPFVRYSAASALGNLAKEASVVIPALVTNLGDVDVQARWGACLALARFKGEAASALPALQAVFQDPAPEVHGSAAIALAAIQPDDAATIALVMPALIQDIEGIGGSASLNFQYPSINAVADCGPLAKAAVPALVKCLKAPDVYTHQAAAAALKKIDPEAATAAGVN